jgi:hypothetical protein
VKAANVLQVMLRGDGCGAVLWCAVGGLQQLNNTFSPFLPLLLLLLLLYFALLLSASKSASLLCFAGRMRLLTARLVQSDYIFVIRKISLSKNAAK